MRIGELMTNENLPATMMAVKQDKPDGSLSLREVPLPRPQRGQVLVRMAAAPINPSDLGSLAGRSYRGERQYPFTPGIEGSGTVVAAGPGLMPRLLKGRRVACSARQPGDGTWAEYMLTSARQCIPLNKGLSLEQGAMLLVNPLTALAVFEIARNGRHRAIVSTAAASALGGMLLKMGQRSNLPIIHIVRRQEQVELVRSRGGEHILNSSEPGFAERLQAEAQKLNATLLLDAIGGSMTRQLADAAPYGSTILLYARLSGQDSEIDSGAALVKDLRFEGWLLSNWLRKKNGLQVLLLSRQVQSTLAIDLQSPIHRRMPLSVAQEAVDAYRADMTAGKMLLVADPQQVPLV